MTTVIAYTTFNTIHEFEVESIDKAREYAKRIITEGLMIEEEDGVVEVFFPITQIWKVKVVYD